MKKTDKPHKTIINVNIFSNINITLDSKSLIIIVVCIVSLALVTSICDPNVRADIIRFLISMTIDC